MKTLKEKMGITSAKDFMLINLGIVLAVIGLHFFRNPNKFAMGGITGLSIVLSYFLPGWPIGSLMMVLNIVLLVLALFFLGKDFVIRTVYVSLTLSLGVILLEKVYPMPVPFTSNKLMELIYAVFLPGIGMGIILNAGATTGGTDIIAKIISKYFKLRMSISLFISDIFIALAAGIIYGMETLLYSLLGLMLSTFVVDSFLESLEVRKIMVIISPKSKEIEEYICNTINRGATVHKAIGAYKRDERDVITTVLSRGQAKSLQNYIKEVDPLAFITITNSSSIIGIGFKSLE